MSTTVLKAAEHFQVDPSTIRRDIQDGCPCLRKGAKGPGRGALLDLQQVAEWRARRRGPAGLSVEDVLQRIAVTLGECVEHDRLALRVNISREESAAVVIVVWEKCCHAFGKSYPYDRQPDAICAAMRVL